MRRVVKIVLILALLSWAALGLRHARGQRAGESMPAAAGFSEVSRPHEEIAVYTGDGAFVLKNLRLVRMTNSTVLKGDVLNRSGRDREELFFEVRAYDRGGRLLTGSEERTIFAVRQLGARASAPINHDHGVWLQGVPTDAIARLEVFESRDISSSPSSPTEIEE
jgi:hypothetical protein